MFRRVIYKWNNGFIDKFDKFSKYILKETDIPFEGYAERLNVMIITDLGYSIMKSYFDNCIVDCKKVDLFDITFFGNDRMDIIQFKESQPRTLIYDRASVDSKEYIIDGLYYMDYKVYVTESEVNKLNNHKNVEIVKLKNIIKVSGLGVNKEFSNIKNKLRNDFKDCIYDIKFKGIRANWCEIIVIIDVSKIDLITNLNYFRVSELSTVKSHI